MSELHNSNPYNLDTNEHPRTLARGLRQLIIAGQLELTDCTEYAGAIQRRIDYLYLQDSGLAGLQTELYMASTEAGRENSEDIFDLEDSPEDRINLEAFGLITPVYIEMYKPVVVFGNFSIGNSPFPGLWLYSTFLIHPFNDSHEQSQIGVVSIADSDFTRASEGFN